MGGLKRLRLMQEKYRPGELVVSDEVWQKHQDNKLPPIISEFDWATGQTIYITVDGSNKQRENINPNKR